MRCSGDTYQKPASGLYFPPCFSFSHATTFGQAQGSNALTLSLTPALAAYAPGLRVIMVPTALNTGDASVDIDGLGPVPLRKNVNVILDSADLRRRDISSLQTLQYGGSAIVGARLDQALAAFGVRLLHSFGMTETTSHASILGKEGHLTHVGSVGKPLPGVEMRIVDDTRNVLDAEEIGEIEVKGENVMKGYWRNPQATAETLREGWLATGDLGRRDADGHYYIVGRKKDLIISGGVNIYPADIENVLAMHPDVAEVAVFGAPDPRWGESVVAAVILRQGAQPDTDELRAFVRGSLGGLKTPRDIRIMDALPKNGSGKVLKRELRAMSWPAPQRR